MRLHSAIGWGLGAAWALVVAVAASGAVHRLVIRRPDGTARRRPGSGRSASPRLPAPHERTPIDALGLAVLRLAGIGPAGIGPAGTAGRGPSSEGEPRRPPDGRRAGRAVLASGLLLAVAPAVAALPVAWAVAAPVLAARRDRARHEAQLHDQLPDIVDLLALTTAAGLPVGAALDAIGDRPGGPLGAALARAGAHVRHGGSTTDALALVAAAGPPVRPLVDALAQHTRYGTPLLPALDRVAIEARARRRRRAEEDARRLPVTLLFPLVLTTFPAFVALTVVPLLAGSLGSLSLSPT